MTLPIFPTSRLAARRVWANFIGSGESAGLPSTLARHGSLEARLAVSRKDVRRAQRLRYRVFFEEGGAIADPTSRLIRRDVCRFDTVCDHLLVVDHEHCDRRGAPKVVGVYRLLRQDVAERAFGFSSASEFDVAALVARWPGARFLELGRACVAPAYRGRRVLDLLWRGIASYAQRHEMDALIGCASLPGARPQSHAATIRALVASRSDPRRWVTPTSDRAAFCDLDAVPPADPRALARTLPPLIKGYLRLGATFSPSPAVDLTFGTTDLFVVLPLAEIEARYLRHFGAESPLAPIAA